MLYTSVKVSTHYYLKRMVNINLTKKLSMNLEKELYMYDMVQNLKSQILTT